MSTPGWMLGALAGCNAFLSWSGPAPVTDTALPAPTSTATGTGPTTATTPSGTTTPAPLDCEALPDPGPPEAWSFTRGGEEFAFDAGGYLVTFSDADRAVVRATRDGATEVVAPYFSSEVAGVDILLGGDLVLADEAGGSLVRFGWDGANAILRSGLRSPNSLAVHPGGAIVTTAYDQLLRIDPDTGESMLLAAEPGHDLDGVAFSPDAATVYFNEDSTGRVWRLALDADAGPAGEPELLAELSTSGGELDGATTDACGNLYVVRTDGAVYRIAPDGTAVRYLALGGRPYTSAIHFGSGRGGWEADHLYLLDRYGRMIEVAAGVPGAPEPHLEEDSGTR